MALFTDSDIVTAADLASHDPELPLVQEAIQPPPPIEGPGSIIRNSVDECAHEIRMKFQNFSGYLVSPGINLNHVAAVQNILSTAINRPRMRLNQVVALDPDPTKCLLRHWLLYNALYHFYRAAYARFSGGGDRYSRKMQLFEDEASKAWSRLIADGIPVVLNPIPCPGAIREFGVGTWGDSNVTAGGNGSTETGNEYYVAITWVSQPAYVSSTSKGNAESGGSAIVATQPAAVQVITASIAGLKPPGNPLPAVGTADGLYTQLTATGWNVYVGTSQNSMFLQNITPIALSTTTYTLPNAPVLAGSILQPGQFADYNFAFQNMLLRS
jgi:hypothetical protein